MITFRWLALVVAILLVFSSGCTTPASPGQPCEDCDTNPTSPSGDADAFGFAVIGDYPYSETQRRRLNEVVGQLNRDPDVDFVFHLGDIKAAGNCTDRYYAQIKADFDKFSHPLVYTFGDNEWADCSRPDNGNYQPLDRLAALRRTFVPRPGFTLGRPVPVRSQAKAGYPENVSFVKGGLSFGVFHAVGSLNGLDIWSGQTKVTSAQRAEVRKRSANAVQVIQRAFAAARQQGSETVVLMTQADMFYGSANKAGAAPYQTMVAALAKEAAAFSGTVYLFNGDSHNYVTDRPLTAVAGWPAIYRVPPTDNLMRITIDGHTKADHYLKATSLPDSFPPLSIAKVAFDTERSGSK